MEQHRAGMVAVGAGIGEHVELQCRQFSIAVGARLNGDAHRMPRRGCDELFFAGQFKLDRAASLDGGECQNILDEHFLLAPKPPPTRSQNTLTRSGARPKSSASARRVRNGTCVLERTFRTPAGSIQARPPWVSKAACWTRCVVNVPS